MTVAAAGAVQSAAVSLALFAAMERGSGQAAASAAAPGPGPEVAPSSGFRSRGLGGIGSAETLAALGAVGRRLLWLLPVYLAGRAGLSLGFVVAGVAVYMGWKSRRLGKERSLRRAGLLLSDEEGAVSGAASSAELGLGKSDLPAWKCEGTA
uniref:Uncharacterized protein n=1 Tax=Sphaerodactylus townsendi TaxID=933632 RepID=A0ACB8ELQ1_9SAUR